MGETDPHLPRLWHSAIYDEAGERMVIWGGNVPFVGGDVNDAWALELKGKPEWHRLGSANAPPEPRQGHTAIYDPERQRMVIFAGVGTFNDTWALPLPLERRLPLDREAALPSEPESRPEPLALLAPQPNPFAGEVMMAFTLPARSRVSLAVYDASGRRLRLLAEGAYAPGAHRVSWDGRDATGREAPAGIYFVRLQTPVATRVTKAVLAKARGSR